MKQIEQTNEGAHALLAPSSCERWFRCTPSARLEALMPKGESPFALEGTLAHKVGELRLRQIFGEEIKDANEYLELWESLENEILENGFDLEEVYYNVMEEYGEYIASYVLNKCTNQTHPKIYIEERLNLEPYIPNSFGTADALVISDDEIAVFDLKYGKGVRVDARDNKQMLCYALGALNKCPQSKAKTIRMTIIQPRLHWISEWVIQREELLDFAENVLAPRARLAEDAQGEQCTGKHCKFCDVLGVCKRAYSQIKDLDLSDRLLNREELSQALEQIPLIETFINRVREQALTRMLRGEQIKGFKVVEGRSLTRVSDAQGLADALKSQGYSETDIYKPLEVKGITDLKKLLKKDFESVTKGFICKHRGKPTIAEESDPRQAIITSTPEQEFKDLLS